jgi:GNAT superfamily N-acetyltransferase
MHMSTSAPNEPAAPAAAEPASGWRVRPAAHDDLPGVVDAVTDLLGELGSAPPPAGDMLASARTLVEDSHAGALLVADTGDAIVGVLGGSWQIAIHAPGRYGLIQDLWVHPGWRGQAIGRDLLHALFELAREQGITRIEVGLPRPRFERLRATEAFYHGNGFSPVGLRMRWLAP